MNRINQLVSKLYRSALVIEAERYRQWAMNELTALIPFDSAMWGMGSNDDGGFKLHGSTLINLPGSFTEVLIRPEGSLLLDGLLEQLARPVDPQDLVMPDVFEQSTYFRKLCRAHGIGRTMGIGYLDARSGLYSLICLFRRSQEPFSEQEKEAMELVAYHLWDAASLSFFVHLGKRPKVPVKRYAAVCDGHGILHETQSRFLDLLETRYPGWHGPKLPFDLPDEFGDHALEEVDLRLRTEPLGDMICVRLWEPGPLDRLTSREREIVQIINRGLSFKEAARELGIAPSTVSNQYYRSFGKLGVENRQQLRALLNPGRFE